MYNKSLSYYSAIALSVVLRALTFPVPFVEAAECDDGIEDYSPCSCFAGMINGVPYVDVTCINVTVDEVGQVFNRINRTEFGWLRWTILPDAGQQIALPADVLVDKQFTSAITITLDSPSRRITIDAEAFRSSRQVAQSFEAIGGDWKQQNDYSFLTDFGRLGTIRFVNSTNLPGFHSLPKSLPSIWRLEFTRTTGLEERTSGDTPSAFFVFPNLKEFWMDYNGLSNPVVDRIFDSIAPPADKVDYMRLSGNRLTEVPASITRNFRNIGGLHLSNNSITVLTNGSVTFAASNGQHHLSLDGNKIHTVEFGTFDGGDFYNSYINLGRNQLTSFESQVYQSALEEMYQSGSSVGQFAIGDNPIDCESCGLAWLIRDNFHLLFRAAYGRCSNGTSFYELNPEGYRHCP